MLTFSGIGRLTKDPVSRNVGETSVCKFSMAFNKKIGDKEYTDFFDFEVWGRGGEVIQQYCEKGDQLFVSGQPRQEKWEKDGETRYGITFKVENFTLVGSNKQDRTPAKLGVDSSKKSSRVPQVATTPVEEVPF